MKYSPIKLILSDIDGTILNDNHQIDTKLPLAINDLKEMQIPFILTSARSPHGVFPLMKELGLYNTPIACYNGALILDGTPFEHNLITEHTLQLKEVSIILDKLKLKFPQVSISLYSGSDWIVDRIDKWIDIETNITKDTPIVQDIQSYIHNDNTSIHKLLLVEEPAVIMEVHNFLQNLNLEDSIFYLSKDNYLEVTSKTVSKKKALFDIANYYNIPLSNTMTIGDNFNDIPMLASAGLGVVMNNAPREVKLSADVETDSNNNYGVYHAINKYVL